MVSSVNRYTYSPSDYPVFQRVSSSENQSLRSHPNAEMKDRSNETDFPARRASSGIRRATIPLSHHQFMLNRDKEIKGVGYATTSSGLASTGTSKPGVLCLTDGMDLCHGVAVGGENASTGDAKVRVFHVMPENTRAPMRIGAYVRNLQLQGYDVRAAIHGGDDSSSSSMTRLRAVEATLDGLNVPLVFKDTGAGGEGNGPLGAVVENGSVRFINALVKPSR